MLEWMQRRRRPTVRSQPELEEVAPKVKRSVMTGKYLSLFTYLDKRYADTVVLTFAQIEDLLGFALPDLARQREDWWTSPGPQPIRPCYSDSWELAGRTAKPNLTALIVTFDRAA